MANRAYLYFCDDVSALTYVDYCEKRDGSERGYLDSRHQFPLAWFLFFDAQSVLLIPEPDHDWSNLYLARPWDAAKADFLLRVPLLQTWFPMLPARDFETFKSWVQSLQEAPEERFLVVDPSSLEIVEEHAPQMIADLAALDDVALNASEKYERIHRWAFPEAPSELETLRNRVFGYFYGPPIPGYWQHCLPWPDEKP